LTVIAGSFYVHPLGGYGLVISFPTLISLAGCLVEGGFG
jgi:hypothetical protein